MLSEDDNLGIYDDLDEFQQAEDHKSKELLAWEVKHRNALTEIEDLKAQNKALGKKIKTMEVNLQNLLETAKSEVKRKEVLIGQLRKEKDDICFRRKRGREVEDPGDIEQESKRTKSVVKVEPEVKKNPFKVDLRNDANPVEKRSKSPSLSHQKATERRSKAQGHGSETRRKSRERRPSRSRSPRHSGRYEEHRSRGSSSRANRRRSCSPPPRDQVSGTKSQIMTSLFGEDPTDCRESVKKPHLEKSKKMQHDIAAPSRSIELYAAEVAPRKTKTSRQVTIECEDTSAVDGYFEEITAFKPNNPANDIIRNTGDFVGDPVFGEARNELIPGLDMICDPPAQEIIELGKENRETSAAKLHSDFSKMDHTTESVTWDLISVRNEEPKTLVPNRNVISDDNSQVEEHPQVVPTATEFSKLAKESLIKNSKHEHVPIDRDGIDNVVQKSELNHSFNKLTKDDNVDVNAQLLAQRDENINCSSGESNSQPKSDCDDVGIRIIEDIRLPEVADIGHIAVIVDRLCDGLEEVGTKPASDEQTYPSGKDADLCDPHDSNKANCSLSELKESFAPASSLMDAKPSSVLYAQPDSTKVDHNDAENEVILEAAMDLLMGSDLAQPQSAPSLSYPNLSLEEDAIEKALGQLHQTQSPDETVVTSTSSRARKADNQAPPECPVIVEAPTKGESQAPEVLQLELPSPCQDITIDETIDEGISNEDLSKVTKRCSLGHTDYQFEQRNDEIILRVKRRTRRRCQAPLDGRVPNPPT